MDDPSLHAAATQDPAGFVAGLPAAVAIDEVQRAPDLLLSIKQRVDADQTAGQFLLTGSANLLTAPRIADALTGRAEYLHLHPFTQRELRATEGHLIARLFHDDPPALADQPVGRGADAEIVAAGGYPDAYRRVPARRRVYFRSYVDTLLERDLSSVVAISDRAAMRTLLDTLAARSSAELNFDRLSRDLRVAANTVRARVDVLETLFLVRRLPAWNCDLAARRSRRRRRSSPALAWCAPPSGRTPTGWCRTAASRADASRPS